MSDLQKLGLESRFHLFHESEAKLLGVTCSETGIMTGAPYRVVDGAHEFFGETGLMRWIAFWIDPLINIASIS